MNPTSPGPRTLDQFGTPHGDFMPDVAEFDRMFHAVEMTLVPQVPKDVRMRIQTARNLGVYAGFSYDLGIPAKLNAGFRREVERYSGMIPNTVGA